MKRLTVLAMALVMLISLTACGGASDNVAPAPSSEPETETATTDAQTKVKEKIDLEALPSLIEPIQGYHPYILQFYAGNELMQDYVPYFEVSDNNTSRKYTIQQATGKGIITGVSAYTADGYECDIGRVLTWSDENKTAIATEKSCVYVFYLKDGIDVEIRGVHYTDFLSFKSLDIIKMYWGNAALSEFGYGYKYLICTVPTDTGKSGYPDNTVTYLDIYTESFRGKDQNGAIHDFFMISSIDEHTVHCGDYDGGALEAVVGEGI